MARKPGAEAKTTPDSTREAPDVRTPDPTSDAAATRREAHDRKTQIIKSAVGLMSDHGVAGTTTARIAADVGVSEPALYRHFENKQGILLAALDDISARLLLHTLTGAAVGDGDQDLMDQLHNMSAAFYDYVMSNQDEMRVLVEVMNAVSSGELRDAVRERFAQLLAVVEGFLAEGVRQGLLRRDLDVSISAWEIASLGVTLYFASSLGFENVLTKKKALTAVDRLLETMVTPGERAKSNDGVREKGDCE